MLERFYDCSFKRRRILLALGLHSDEVGWITDVMSSPLYHRRWRRSDHDDHINHRRWWWWWWWLAVVNYSQSIEMSSLINCDWSFNQPWLGILWLIIFNHVIIASLQLLQLHYNYYNYYHYVLKIWLLIQLIIPLVTWLTIWIFTDISNADSGNYTCQIRGQNYVILAESFHRVFVKSELSKLLWINLHTFSFT